MVLGIADDGDAPAVAAHGLALGHGVDGVIGALAVDVRLQLEQQRRHGRFRKNDDVGDAAQGGDELGPILFGEERPVGPLQGRDRPIVVDGDDEAIGFARGRLEVADVAGVQQIEAAVREGDGAAGGAIRLNGRQQLGAGQHASHVMRAHGPGPRRRR